MHTIFTSWSIYILHLGIEKLFFKLMKYFFIYNLPPDYALSHPVRPWVKLSR